MVRLIDADGFSFYDVSYFVVEKFMMNKKFELNIDQEMELYLCLAELFFLDTEPQDYQYAFAAKLIKQSGMSKEKVLDILVTEIAPVSAANLGFLSYPTLGEWAGFGEDMYHSIVNYRLVRNKRSRILCMLQDAYYKRMLKQLDVETLFSYIPK